MAPTNSGLRDSASAFITANVRVEALDGLAGGDTIVGRNERKRDVTGRVCGSRTIRAELELFGSHVTTQVELLFLELFEVCFSKSAWARADAALIGAEPKGLSPLGTHTRSAVVSHVASSLSQ
jgi:hypothetical protein